RARGPASGGGSRAACADRGRTQAEEGAAHRGAEAAAHARASLREVGGNGGRGGDLAVRGGRRGTGGMGVTTAPDGEEGTGAGDRASRRAGADGTAGLRSEAARLQEGGS